jgi:hypothetical protein
MGDQGLGAWALGRLGAQVCDRQAGGCHPSLQLDWQRAGALALRERVSYHKPGRLEGSPGESAMQPRSSSEDDIQLRLHPACMGKHYNIISTRVIHPLDLSNAGYLEPDPLPYLTHSRFAWPKPHTILLIKQERFYSILFKQKRFHLKKLFNIYP